jgi:hypothetical protein
MPTLKQSGLNIVAVGDFNTKIFQPAWFSGQKLISETETNGADQVLVSEQLSTFKLPWVMVRVIPHQFVAATTHDSQFEAVRDLVVGTFKLLLHTPVRQLGINLERHYLCENEDRWNQFGHKLAPKDVWFKFMKDPGLLKMVIMDKSLREGGPPGNTQIEIAGSVLFRPGIYFQVNNHYEVLDASGASTMVTTLESSFAAAMKQATGIIDSLISLA